MTNRFGIRFVLSTYIGGFAMMALLAAATPDRTVTTTANCELGCTTLWNG